MNLESLPSLAPVAEQCRERIRNEQHTGPTAGLAAGYVQANLMILPKDWADEFLLFSQRNPKPCPILAVTEPGQHLVPSLGSTIDVRTDFPRYRVWRNGELCAEPLNIRDLWRDDLVSFLIGCSFSFEEALLADGIDVRHISAGVNVPMYRSTIQTQATRRLAGPLVVSMRPMRAADAIRAIQITSRFPSVHGAPVHIGDPALIGITDIHTPDYGDAVEIRPDELPVFWACGVTPQAVAAQARPEFCITHAPGHMLITDIPNTRLAAL
ncbi:putative hydro-lyase [Alcaligenes sp. SDU_A2]|uniref:putative hydro-lyase n=1 Tax=Alcaligenes sp. SDU_A2 TaxID=3136634 RepID=UPI002C1C2F45|nr:putative hydro-lyase [Alcaligenes sp.]HRL27856.1 putative hydro-lyase [Alcaligenes sp.]